MIAGDLPDIPEYMDPGTLKVHAPFPVVIVCGGPAQIDFNKPIESLRDAFMRVVGSSKIAKYDVRLAEDVIRLPTADYKNLLRLEHDVSQISELVLLFLESAGSLAELGVFSMDDEISARLMVVVDGFNFEKNSFIRRGILDYLEEDFGDETVCVIDLLDHGASTIANVSELNPNSFKNFIEDKIQSRLKSNVEPTTFVRGRNGHLIKLMTGLIQNYASLTFDEIDVLLYSMGVTEPSDKLKRLLACAEKFKWIKIQKSGNRTFYSALGGRIAINFDLMPSHAKVNRIKWRADVRLYWKETDPDRFKCISAAATEAA